MKLNDCYFQDEAEKGVQQEEEKKRKNVAGVKMDLIRIFLEQLEDKNEKNK